MRYFQGNPNFYKPFLESYTSPDEFYAAKRVHINNEIPPEDLFDKVHSTMKNEFWQWFLGYSYLTYDMEYNIFTDNEETYDKDGNIETPGIAKYINGIRAKNYGPLPKLVWNVKEQDYVIQDAPKYNRLEVNGTIMPEFDFLLHEGYRYLSVLYPDHPDFMELLTLNEFNDEIQQSAAIIDYRINCKFMDWLSQYLQYPDEDYILEEQMQEASMLKIRNLLNHSFRRKFYGSKVGYQMLGADIYQHVSVYPVAEYLPIHNYQKVDNYEPEAKDFKWKRNYENKPAQYKDWEVNKFDKLYKKLFRLVDWTNESYDYQNRYEPPIPYYGTAYPTPLSPYDLYEYPLERDFDVEGDENFLTDFKSGQKIWLNGQPSWEKSATSNIFYINKEPAYRVKVSLSYVNDVFDPSLSSQAVSNDKDVVHIKIDTPMTPNYTTFKIYPSNEKTLAACIEYNKTLTNIINEDGTLNTAYINLEEYDRFIETVDTNKRVFESTKYLANLLYENDENGRKNQNIEKIKLESKEGQFTIDPHQHGTLYVQPAQFLTLYQDELNYTINIDSWLNKEPDAESELIFEDTKMEENGFVQRGDILSNKWEDDAFLAEIVGMTKGYVQFRIDNSEKMRPQEIETLITNVNREVIPTKGLVFSLYDGPNKGKKICLYGRPTFEYTVEPDADNLHNVVSVYFNIAAIPRVKSMPLCKALYKDYETLADSKYKNLYTIFGGENSSLEENTLFIITKNLIDSISNSFVSIDSLIKEMITLSKAGKGELHSNDIHWKELIKLLDSLEESFELRPVLQEQVSRFIDEFLENAHKEIVFDKTPDIFEQYCNSLIENIREYGEEIIRWSKDVLLVDINRDYYQEKIDLETNDYDVRAAWKEIDRIDNLLDNEWLPNRSLLLTPYPEDNIFLTNEIVSDAAYSLTDNLDNFECVFSTSLNKYQDLIEYNVNNKWGTSGKLTNITEIEIPSFDFGTINIASTVESHFNDEVGDWETLDILDYEDGVDRIDDHFVSSNVKDEQLIVGPNYTREYLIEDDTMLPELDENFVRIEGSQESESGPHKCYSLNKDIITVIDNSTDLRKFSYADPNFLELFLPDNKKLNIKAEIDVKTKVEIRSYTTLNSNIIEIRDEASFNRLGCITSGDQVIGKTIENDTFVEDIDLEKGLITVNKNLSVTGNFVLTYLCQINTFPEENSEDFFKYREQLSKNKLADDGSIFNHGVYGSVEYPNISQSFLRAPLDVSSFRTTLLHNLQDQPVFRDYFNKIVEEIHHQGKANTYAVPSAYNIGGDLFFEVNAYQTFDFKSWERDANNSLDNTGFIMKKEILDYLEENLSDISRASDSVNVGVNISAYTRADGKVSQYDGEYSDPNIKAKFITTPYWNRDTLPVYIDVGIGRLDNLFEKTEVEENEESISNQGHLYDYDQYGQALYRYKSPEEIIEEEEKEDSIDKPIMRMYIGEYEVQKNINFENYFSDRNFTTVQFSVIKQVFKNLEKENEVKLNVVSSQFFTSDILKTWPNNYKQSKYVTEAGVGVTVNLVTGNTNRYIYLGEWTPTVSFNSEKNCSEINYPPIPHETVSRNYYTISKDTKLSDVASKYNDYNISNYEFNTGDIIMYVDEKWEQMSFAFSGIYGEAAALSTYFDTDEYLKIHEIKPNITCSYCLPPSNNDINTEEETLKHVLLRKIIGSMSGTSSANLNYEDCIIIFESLYYNLIDETDLKNWCDKNQKDFVKYRDVISANSFTPKSSTKANIFWFMFAGGRDDSDWQLFDKVYFNKGQTIGLIYYKSNFDIFLLNDNVFLYKINAQNELLNSATSLKDEYFTFLGTYGPCKLLPSLSLVERIKTVSNEIDVGYQNLLSGSVSTQIKIDPGYKSEGWKYRDDGTLNTGDQLVEFNITEDSIYHDDVNNYLYTFNRNEAGEREKYALKLEDNKFFKNILFLNAAYKKQTTSKDGILVENGVLSPITGIQFDADQVSVFDRVLQLEQINVRSVYKSSLEPTLFSSYCNITGELKGFKKIENDENTYMVVGYTFNQEPVLTSNKLKHSTELKKLLPITDAGKYRQESIIFGQADLEGNIFTSPSIMGTSVLQDISKNPDASLIKYFKNTLVLEGVIDIANPGLIDFGANPKLKDALNYVSSNDPVVSIVGLTASKSSSYKIYEIKYGDSVINTKDLKFIDYKNSVLIAVFDGAIYLKYLESLLAITENVVEFTHCVSDDISDKKITSLSWDQDFNKWYFSTTDEDGNNTGIYGLTYTKVGTLWEPELTIEFNSIGTDINTYQLIDIPDVVYGSDRFDTKVSDIDTSKTLRVAARDVSFAGVLDIENGNIEDFGNENLWTTISKTNNVGLPTVTITEIGPSVFTGKGIQVATETGFEATENAPLSVFDQGNKDGRLETNINIGDSDYKILELDFNKSESSGDNFSLSFGCYDNVIGVWTYDNSTDKWALSEMPKVFFNAVDRYTSSEKAHARIYVCSHTFSQGMEHNIGLHSEDHSDSPGEFLWKLPRAEAANNEYTIAYVLSTSETNLLVSVNREPNASGIGKFDLTNIQLKDYPVLGNDFAFTEGPYEGSGSSSGFVSNLAEKNKQKRWVASNDQNYQAVIIGSTLFVKSPTKVYEVKENANKIIIAGEAGTTKGFHWKKGELPSVRNINYELFNEMTLDEAYTIVKNQYDIFKDVVNERWPDGTKKPDPIQAQLDWMENNPPFEYLKEGDLPIEIKHNGIRILDSANGKIVDYNTNHYHKWSAPQDVYFEAGISSFVYLTRQNYLRYLADYFEVILGCNRFVPFYKGGISDVKLTETDLVIQTNYGDLVSIGLDKLTSREDIENYNNWKITAIDTTYTYTSNNVESEQRKIIGINGRFVAVDEYPTQNVIKTLSIVDTFYGNGVQIIAGYVLANKDINDQHNKLKEINSEYSSRLIENYPNDGNTVFSFKYPVIYASLDNGKTFQKQPITPNDQVLELGKYTGTTGRDIDACSIVLYGQEIRVYLRLRVIDSGESKIVGYLSYPFEENGISTNIQFFAEINQFIENDVTNSVASSWKNFSLDGGTIKGVLPSSSVANIDNGEQELSYKFALNMPFTFNVGEAFLTETTETTVMYSPTTVASSESEQIRVLVSIDPSRLLQNQTQYFDYKSEYLSQTGGFKVPLFTEVTDRLLSNRCYSPRECLTINERGFGDLTGIPAIAEDIGHSVFEYYDPYQNSNNETVYEYIPLENQDGQKVALCYEDGRFLSKLNQESADVIFGPKEIIELNIDYDDLIAAPRLVEGFEAIKEEEHLKEVLNNTILKKVSHLNFSGSAPELLFNSPSNFSDVINYLIGETDKNTINYLYEWPTSIDGVPEEWTEEMEAAVMAGVRNSETEKYAGIISCMAYIQTFENEFNTVYNPVSQRLTYEKIGEKYYVKDVKYDIVLLREFFKITLNCSVPYNFANGQQSYKGMPLSWDEKGNLKSYSDGYELNTIYLPPKGYGGFINNTSWENEAPHEIDYMAFGNELATNANNEYIYLCNELGNTINVKNGLFFQSSVQKTEINWDNIANEKQKVSISENYGDFTTDFNLYKRMPGNMKIFTPKEYIYFNPSPEGLDKLIADREMLLTYVTLTKSGKEVYFENNEDFLKEYSVEIFDAEGNILKMRDSATEDIESVGLSIEYDNSRRGLFLKLKDGVLNYNVPYIWYNMLVLKITDLITNVSIIKELRIDDTHNDNGNDAFEYYKITKMYNIDKSYTGKNYNKGQLLDNDVTLNIEFDETTLNDSTLSVFDKSLAITKQPSQQSPTATILINELPKDSNISIGNEVFSLDLRDWNIEVLVNRDWVFEDRPEYQLDSVKINLYSDDQLYKSDDEINFEITELDDKYIIYFEEGLNSFETVIKKEPSITNIIPNIMFDEYIFTKRTNPIEFRSTNENILIAGLFGNILFVKPTYNSFKELIDALGQIIEYKNRRIIATWDLKNPIPINEIQSVDSSYKNVTLSKIIEYGDLNDGNEHFLRVKLLPLNTIYPKSQFMNNPDYIWEIPYNETSTYGFDRVWINENSYPAIPMQYKGIFYNEKNQPYYNLQNWKNKDGYMVYTCDEYGRFTKAVPVSNSLSFVAIGDQTGNCTNEIYGNVDPRVNPLEPLYTSSIDWYLGAFYIKGKETNPFISYLDIKDEFDQITNQYIQKLSISQPKKVGNNIEYLPIDDSYLTGASNTIGYTTDGEILFQTAEQKLIDHKNGKLSFFITGPGDDYMYDEYKYYYGIRYKNSFNIQNGENKEYWSGKCQLKNNILLNFYLNTTENLIDRKNRDYSVVGITEMGLFDKNNKLVAYITHPKAEYRTDTQHLSYSLIIEEL